LVPTVMPFEFQTPPITVKEFVARMGTTMPPELKALSKPDAPCIEIYAFRRMTAKFSPPLTQKEADYAFCGMDPDYNRLLCPSEFYAVLKIGQFFPSKSQLNHLEEVGALAESFEALFPTSTSTLLPATTTTIAPTTSPQITSAELQAYQGVAAVINGHCAVSLRTRAGEAEPGNKEQSAIAKAFRESLEQELALHVNIADIEGLHVRARSHPNERTLMILWTAGSVEDGGRLQLKIRREAEALEQALRLAVLRASGLAGLEHVTVWATATFHYYGKGAKSLPEGSIIAQDIGQNVEANIGIATL